MNRRAFFDDDDGVMPRPAKQQKTSSSQCVSSRPLSYEHYNVAWICALPIELAAAKAMLDKIHKNLSRQPNDSNSYSLGSIEEHNIVIACLPYDQYGTVNAASVLNNIKRTFPCIRWGLMVGIGGGVPTMTDIRLGDVVVGTRVMQYDLGRTIGEGKTERVADFKIPDYSLRTAISSIRAQHLLQPSRVPLILREKMATYAEYSRPNTPDRLFQDTYKHESPNISCDYCDQSQLFMRKQRLSENPVIHYGAIASGNQVMKDAATRNAIAKELDVICFEMEAAGLMDVLPCLPIRGICDYSDSHKSLEWQKYAAATAASFARELLEVLAANKKTTAVEDVLSPIEQSSFHDRRKQILEALRFEQIDARKTTIKAAHSKTCHWFLENPDYLAWLDHEKTFQHHGFLWIKGNPELNRHQDTLISSFFFNARGEGLERSIFGMFRSLLLQLLDGFPDLQKLLDDPDVVPRNQSDCPTLNVLKDLFRSAVSSLGTRSFTCFIDALDECDEQQVMDMVQYFEDLAKHCTENNVQFRICFSSRHYPFIDVQLGIPLVLDNQIGHAGDLEKYIKSNLRIKDPALMNELQAEMLEKAAGIFLWVVLVVDILNKENRRGRLGLRKRLAEVPNGLSELFRDLLQRDQENMEEFQLSILWVLFAKRPLEPGEYYHALWSGLSSKGLADPEIPAVDASDATDCFDRSVISSSKGLAEITKSRQPTVQFIHESIRDFLIKDKGLYELWPNLGFDWESSSHDRLKQCCSFYWNHPQVLRDLSILQPDTTFETRKTILRPYTFLEYASQYVLDHANSAADAIPQQEFLTKFSVPDWIHVVDAFEYSWDPRYSPGAELLYILAERGVSMLIRTRLKQNPYIDYYGERYGHPLVAAMAKGYKDSVVALLGLPSNVHDGIDITHCLQRNLDLEGRSWTPLSWACKEGYFGIAKLLLNNGQSISEEVDGHTLLMLASGGGNVEVARLLIDKGADINSRRKISKLLKFQSKETHNNHPFLCFNLDLYFRDHGYTALDVARINDHGAIVKLLFDTGADVNTHPTALAAALNFAIVWNHKSIANLLITKGADVEAPSPLGERPLHLATRMGHIDTTTLLLEHGAETEARDRAGNTSLFLAYKAKHVAMIRLLLDCGADIDARDQEHQTCLFRASLWGNEAMIKLLLNCGADIDARDVYNTTCLFGASAWGHATVVNLLLDRGADIHATNHQSQICLFGASTWGYEAVVKVLLDRGADPNQRDSSGSTCLHNTVRSAYQENLTSKIQLLIEHGADINACDDYGRTPLDCARGADLVRFLVENGAIRHQD